MSDKKWMQREKLKLPRNADIASKYGKMIDAIAEAASEDETDDEPEFSADPLTPPAGKCYKLILQPWQARKLHEIIRTLDHHHKLHAHNPVGHQVHSARFAINPLADSTASPVPPTSYHWMVNEASAIARPKLVEHVQVNLPTEYMQSSLRWGARPPYEVRDPAEEGRVGNAAEAETSRSGDGGAAVGVGVGVAVGGGDAVASPSAEGEASAGERPVALRSQGGVEVVVESGSVDAIHPALCGHRADSSSGGAK